MGEILGLGLTHYPPLLGRDEDMADILRLALNDPGLPEQYRDPGNWPEPLQKEYGSDGGAMAAKEHREQLAVNFKMVREALDAFQPDVVVIWGDDQYENFKEDIIPPFCIFAYEDLEVEPALGEWGIPSFWSGVKDLKYQIKGQRTAARHLIQGLLTEKVDISYAYQPLHHPGFAHSFVNTLLFLEYGQGFPYPLVAFQVNCYGRRVISQKGWRSNLAELPKEYELDPPSPSPQRCMEVGAATARVFQQSPWRVALIASSSWSHAFLTDKNYQLHPDHQADRRLFEGLRTGNYEAWRHVSLAEIEESGQQELLNWFCLAGAMEELGRKPDECALVETWAFNSNKCFALFKPNAEEPS